MSSDLGDAQCLEHLWVMSEMELQLTAPYSVLTYRCDKCGKTEERDADHEDTWPDVEDLDES
ncbi:MAG: hypothetical protein WAS05_00185 [Candidatus Nanopelagicales bacterium]